MDQEEGHLISPSEDGRWDARRCRPVNIRFPFTGCRNRKGVETVERPHLSQVTGWPETIAPLSLSKVRALAFTSIDRPRHAGDGPTVAIDEEGVMQLFEEYPEQLVLSKITHSGDDTWLRWRSAHSRGKLTEG
jgi:hypothetical protein